MKYYEILLKKLLSQTSNVIDIVPYKAGYSPEEYIADYDSNNEIVFADAYGIGDVIFKVIDDDNNNNEIVATITNKEDAIKEAVSGFDYLDFVGIITNENGRTYFEVEYDDGTEIWSIDWKGTIRRPLATMPFDKDGKQATGDAIWNATEEWWEDEYNED